MTTKSRSVLAALVLGSLAASPAPAGDLVPIRHLSLSASDGLVVGELVVYLRRRSSPDDEPLASVALIETGDGDRARLISYRQDETEIYVHRFEDLGSGWEAEWRLDSGLDNLGDPADYFDPFDWLMEVIERSEKQVPSSRLAIETSDGVVVEWQEPGAPSADREEAERAKLDALARLAVALAEQPPPESVQRSLHVLNLFRRGEGGDELSGFDGLIEPLTTALRAARAEERRGGEEEPPDLSVDAAYFDRTTPPVWRQRAAELLDATTPTTDRVEPCGETAPPVGERPARLAPRRPEEAPEPEAGAPGSSAPR